MGKTDWKMEATIVGSPMTSVFKQEKKPDEKQDAGKWAPFCFDQNFLEKKSAGVPGLPQPRCKRNWPGIKWKHIKKELVESRRFPIPSNPSYL